MAAGRDATRRLALVTGASAGIGESFAELLAERGFDDRFQAAFLEEVFTRNVMWMGERNQWLKGNSGRVSAHCQALVATHS